MTSQLGDRLSGILIFLPENNPLESFTTDEAVLAYFQEKRPSLGQVMTLENAAALRRRPISKLITVK